MQGKTHTSPSGPRAEFLAFVSDSENIAVLKQFALAKGWEEAVVHQGSINEAIDYLKTHASPYVLCVDVASAEAAATALDELADVCEPDIKVIVSGKINEYSFYCWLTEMGIASYLLKPIAIASIEAAYDKATHVASAAIPGAAEESRKDGEVITVLGVRGGVGATTVGVNLAWLLANQMQKKTAILDFDAQLGTIALSLDLEPSRGLRDALEKPDRIDGLFLDRVMVKFDENLSTLSTEEALEENVAGNEAAVEAMLTQTRPKFAHIVIDLPRTLSPFTRYALKHSDHIICVTEYNIMGLRESLRYLDYCRDILKTHPPIFVANKVGLAGKYQMPQSEFEKGLGAKISYNIPFSLDVLAASTEGQVISEKIKTHAMTKALQALAGQFASDSKSAPESKGMFGFLKGGK